MTHGTVLDIIKVEVAVAVASTVEVSLYKKRLNQSSMHLSKQSLYLVMKKTLGQRPSLTSFPSSPLGKFIQTAQEDVQYIHK